MTERLLSFVEQAVTADLEDLTDSQLQAHALELQRASGRLAGRDLRRAGVLSRFPV